MARFKKICSLILILTLCLGGCGLNKTTDTETTVTAPSTVTENDNENVNDWVHDAPENHNMNKSTLNALHTALDSVNIYSAVTVKDGVIVDEYYKNGYDETTVFPLHSCSKSFTSALVGLAIEDGFIKSVDEPISNYLPQVRASQNALHKKITIRHLLTHTSGISWNESTSYVDFMEWQRSENWIDFILARPVTSEPGARFNYSTAGTHLLGAVVEQAVGKSLFEYGKEKVFTPLGMGSVEWGRDPQGVTDGGNGIRMNVYDMAKFGQLFLNDGKWNGKQIIPQKWVEESTEVQVNRAPNYVSYGYQWWVRQFGSPSHETFFAQGFGGQLIFVVPDLNLVSVFTSDCPDNTHTPWSYFENYVLSACEGSGD